MSNILDGFSNGVKGFIWDYEQNRGEIKNRKKFYPILANIYANAHTGFIEELTRSKRIGIQMVEKIVVTLSIDEQEEMLDGMRALRRVNKTNVDLLYAEILNKRQ